MENNKYYIPDIEDIHIGYECELKLKENSKTKWCKIIIEDGQDIEEIVRSYCYGIPNDIRTPYLTKEQIEAEGWKSIGNMGILDLSNNDEFITTNDLFVRDDYPNMTIHYNYAIHDMWITIPGKIVEHKISYRANIFHGECKSINEFRYICNLLNIK